MKYSEVIEFRVDPSLKKTIQELARQDRHTLSNYLRKLFKEKIDQYNSKKNIT